MNTFLAMLAICTLSLSTTGVSQAADVANGAGDLPSLSSVRATSYNAETKVLTVEFVKYGTYEYSGVPKEVNDALEKADSKVAYFNENVRNKYPAKKISGNTDS